MQIRTFLVVSLLAVSPALFAQSAHPGHAVRTDRVGGEAHRDPRGVPVAKLDLNGDGYVSRDEMEAFRQQHQQRQERREDRKEHRGDPQMPPQDQSQ